MLVRLAWRNLWRNTQRSGVLLAAIALGMWAGLFLSAITAGYLEQRFDQVITQELSHVQVHHPQFLAEREVEMGVPDAGNIRSWLMEQSGVLAVAPRLRVDAMIQSSVRTSGVELRGVDPAAEAATTQLHKRLSAGGYLPDGRSNPILLGEHGADQLGVELGQRVVLSFQTPAGELTSAAFVVTGLFATGSDAREASLAYARLSDLAGLLEAPALRHEVAILLDDESRSPAIADALNARFDGIAAETWSELSPELRYLNEMGNSTTYILMGVILLALAFGLLNTLLMSIFERTRELCMLLAIGMQRRSLFLMILIESVLLTLVGAAVGLGAGMATIFWLGAQGLDLAPLGGDALAQFGYDPVVYPQIGLDALVGIVALVVMTAILAALYPAWRVRGLQPATAVAGS